MDFDYLQRSAGKVKQVGRAWQHLGTGLTVNVALDLAAHLIKRNAELAVHELQRMSCKITVCVEICGHTRTC